MPKYVASTEKGFEPEEVVESIEQLGAKISGWRATPNSVTTSGQIRLECAEELAEKLKHLRGVRHFEELILHTPIDCRSR